MCSTSKVNEMIGNLASGSHRNIAPGTSIPSVSANRLRQYRSLYYCVDVREPDELTGKLVDLEVDAEYTVGALLRDAPRGKLDDWKSLNKTIVLISSSGGRSGMAYEGLRMCGFHNVAVLQRGNVGLTHAAGCIPDFLVVLGVGDSSEKLSLALAACATAVETHETVVLAVMADGVNVFQKQAAESQLQVNDVDLPPFKPCKAMLRKFIDGNGQVLMCTTCAQRRGLEFGKDLMDCVAPLQMPDLIRMLSEAKASLQFT
jgi:sulfur relay (sulfurtransferase) complex TusBCD TusD component (DsrE family)/rhodanese-related sulfurtransferase